MIRIIDAIDGFFTARAPRKDSPHTVAAYRRDLMFVSALLAERAGVPVEALPCSALALSPLRKAFAAFADGRAKSSIARCWSTWNTFCGFLVSEGVLEGNPMAGVARPQPPSRQPKPLRGEDTPDDLLVALASGARKARDPWPERDLTVIATLLLTGLRSAELLALTVGDLAGPVGERRLSVRAGKGDADRSLPVEPALENLIEGYVLSRRARLPQERRPLPTMAALFVDGRGERLTRNQLQYLVRQCYRYSGVSDRVERGALVHALRHTFATRLGQSGASAMEIMELLGHRSLSASQGYLKTTARELRDAARSNPSYRLLERLQES
ncbi:tyrosine-type recombinase/integrase [Longispora urticae]